MHSPLDRLELALRHGAGEVLAITLIQVDANECEFSCCPQESVVLPLGTTIMLVFFSQELEQRLELPATVVFRNEHPHGRRYRVRFATTVQLPLPLYALMTQRSNYRVKPAPRKPVSIRVCPAPFQDRRRFLSGQIADLSVSGVGISLKHDSEVDLAPCEQVHLEFELPGTSATLRLVGRIRNRTLLDNKLVYGVEFDPHTTSFSEQERAIRAYVATRLQDEAKRADRAQTRLGAFL